MLPTGSAGLPSRRRGALRRWPLVAALAAALLAGAALLATRPRAAPPPRPVANHAFPSAPRPRAPAVLWAVGDGADGGAAAKALARRIAAARPSRFLYLGDVYPLGTPRAFRSGYASVYGALARRTAPTPGNHDWPQHPTGYDRYWRSVTGAPTPPWYALRIGGWLVLSLNSEAPHGAGSPQDRWLRGRLARHRGTCALAFWHRPLMSAGSHGDQPDVRPFWDRLRGHAALVLNGHDHNLQRLRPRDGIVEIVAGAGGRGHYSLNAGDPRLAFADTRNYGAARIALRPGGARIDLVSTGGRVLDSSQISCRTA